jgi:hypothetical protein
MFCIEYTAASVAASSFNKINLFYKKYEIHKIFKYNNKTITITEFETF